MKLWLRISPLGDVIRDGLCSRACHLMLEKVSRSIDTITPPTPYIREPFPVAIAMSSSCNCIAGAVKGLRPTAALRNPLRTAARRSLTSSSTAAPRITTGQGTLCLRRSEVQPQQWRSAVGSLRSEARWFSNTTSRQKLKTIEQVKARNKSGVSFLWMPF
jgi:hypothetical protein